jgi:hypothetical protein
MGVSAVAYSLDSLAVALTIGLDAHGNRFCGIPNPQIAGSLQHERRQPRKSAILAAARAPRNLPPKPVRYLALPGSLDLTVPAVL